MTSPLPEWPDRKQYGVRDGHESGPKNGERGAQLVNWGISQLQEETAFAEANYRAAMARLRVAVEALRHLVAMIGECSCHEAYKSRRLTDPTCAFCNDEVEDAAKALTLCDLPKEGCR